MAVDLIARALAVGAKTSLTLAGLSLTGSQATSSLDISALWNTTGTPTALKVNVTDTASNAASLFIDIQRNSSPLFSVGKNCVIKGTSNATITLGTDITLTNPNATRPINIEGFLNVTGAIAIGQSSGQTQNTADLTAFRDAANIWAQRRGTNPQTFRVYNTFTDASNYERGFVRYSSNVLQIGHEGAGTGSGTRRLEFITAGYVPIFVDGANITLQSTVNVSNSLTLTNATGSGFIQLTEQSSDPAAGAANTARLFSRDSGGGKTQICVRFNSGAVQVIATEP